MKTYIRISNIIEYIHAKFDENNRKNARVISYSLTPHRENFPELMRLKHGNFGEHGTLCTAHFSKYLAENLHTYLIY